MVWGLGIYEGFGGFGVLGFGDDLNSQRTFFLTAPDYDALISVLVRIGFLGIRFWLWVCYLGLCMWSFSVQATGCLTRRRANTWKAVFQPCI